MTGAKYTSNQHSIIYAYKYNGVLYCGTSSGATFFEYKVNGTNSIEPGRTNRTYYKITYTKYLEKLKSQYKHQEQTAHITKLRISILRKKK